MSRRLAPLAALVVLAGCSSSPSQPNGCIAYSPAVPLVMSAGRACATQLDEHWAVTAKHARDVMVFSDAVVDKVVDPDYDLAFFRHEGAAPEWGDARVGEAVTAEGNPGGALDFLLALPVPLRERANGHVIMTDVRYCGTPETPLTCTLSIAYSGPVEPGYSGGPLIGERGRIIGMTSAVVTKPGAFVGGVPLPVGTGVALPSELILAEYRRLVKPHVWCCYPAEPDTGRSAETPEPLDDARPSRGATVR